MCTIKLKKHNQFII